MKRKMAFGLGVSLIVAAAWASAQTSEPAPPAPIPAAKVSQVECSGFISTAAVSDDVHVFDGADNDFRGPYHVFKTGDLLFLRSRSKAQLTVGAEYRLVRPGAEPVLASWFNPDLSPVRAFGRTSWYEGQSSSMRSLGRTYEDVGRVKVTHVLPEGAVAEVTFACGIVEIKDIAIPYQPREIPTYTPTANVARFPLPEGKLWGAITAAPENHGILGNGEMAYINLGESDGVHAGQRFRIFPVDRELLFEGYFHPQLDMPTETTGELVVLSTQDRSSLAIIVSSVREISIGDGIVLEE